MFRNIIFDWSGTLCDDLSLTLDATNYVLAQYGREPYDVHRFRLEFQLPYPNFYARVIPEAHIDDLENHFRHAFDHSAETVCLLPHARTFLEYCHRRGIRCFIMTSMDPKAFDAQCRETQVFSFFEGIHSGIRNKEAHIARLLHQHGLNPADTAFIGDMQHDMTAAHCGGITAIGVLTGYNNAEQLSHARPDFIVPDLAALQALFERATLTGPEEAVRLNSMELLCCVGVPDEERSTPQRLCVDVSLTPPVAFSAMDDSLERTIDYDALSRRLKALAEGTPYRLIETLANRMAECCVSEFRALHAEVEVRKFILPGMQSSSVKTCAHRHAAKE